MWLLLVVGLLGGFTTFSAFGYETFKLIDKGQLMAAILNVVGQVVFGLAGVWVGISVSKQL